MDADSKPKERKAAQLCLALIEYDLKCNADGFASSRHFETSWDGFTSGQAFKRTLPFADSASCRPNPPHSIYSIRQRQAHDELAAVIDAVTFNLHGSAMHSREIAGYR